MESFEQFVFVYQNLIYLVGINGILALSVYLTLAAGQLSLGQAAFMGVGAYTSVIITGTPGIPFPIALLGSIIVPGVLAVAIGIPTLRLAGSFLAFATIGLAEILRIMYLNTERLGGALGVSNIPEHGGFLLIYGTLVILTGAFFLVTRSKFGRALEAIREDEAAAGVMGINVSRYRLAVFVFSAMIAGLAGSLNAHVSSFISPHDYGFEATVTILSFALLGGIGSPAGPILGALILTMLPELLRSLQEFRLAINGLIIVLAVLFMPRGLLVWRPWRTGAGK